MTTKRDDYLREACAEDTIIERTRQQTDAVRDAQRETAVEAASEVAGEPRRQLTACTRRTRPERSASWAPG